MKNQFNFINKEAGFYLPFVLFIITICFIILTASINMYKNEIEVTHKQLEQIKVETLFQISRTKLKNEIKENKFKHTNQITYQLQDGFVTITFMPIEENSYQMHFTILTNKNTYYELTNRLNMKTMEQNN
ncbi:hypothetical protein ACLIBH_12020 [Virgibacillus sp. W0430]|uniref:hypothetical protein n=1 Tax=Virgibacillus sp. W0430 TaxID=3391580 RepID=UPI003F4726EA